MRNRVLVLLSAVTLLMVVVGYKSGRSFIQPIFALIRGTTALAGAGSLHPVTTAIASRFHCGQLDSNRKQNTTRLSRRSAPRRR